MGLAHAVPAAAKATKAASMNVTMMRLTTHLLSSTEVNKGERKGRTPKEPDSRLTAHYIVLARRTLVTRLLVPSAWKTSSVLNSVPTCFTRFHRVMTSFLGGAGPFSPAA